MLWNEIYRILSKEVDVKAVLARSNRYENSHRFALFLAKQKLRAFATVFAYAL